MKKNNLKKSNLKKIQLPKKNDIKNLNRDANKTLQRASVSKTGSTVLITGASSGIGEASALEFAQNGYHLLLLGRSLDKLKKVKSNIQKHLKTKPLLLKHPLQIELLSFDLKLMVQNEKDRKSFQNLLYNKLDKLPPLEILVNNAGVFKTNQTGFSLPPEMNKFEIHKENTFKKTRETSLIWHEQFEVNMMAPVLLNQMVWPYFIKNKKGSIVNISSTLGVKPTPQTQAYSASKAALINYTLSLAQEAGAHNIRVNAICPGIVDTPLHSFHKDNEQIKQKTLSQIHQLQLLAQTGQPEDIAKAIYFLASPLSQWTTGTLLHIDGGINIKA